MAQQSPYQQFIKYASAYHFVGFGMGSISMKKNENGEWKKDLSCFPRTWQNIRDNNKILTLHTNFAVVTGKTRNCTFMDFDSEAAYDTFVEQFPECKSYLTVKTRKGYHVGFQYDGGIGNLSNSQLPEEYQIDFRNDGGSGMDTQLSR